MFFLASTGIVGIAAAAAITKFHLEGEDLSKYDKDLPVDFHPDPNSKGAKEVKAYLIENFVKPARAEGTKEEKLKAKRARFDKSGLDREFPASTMTDVILRLDGHELTGEWVVPKKGVDTDRRLLYIHGGANTVGSAVSHRAITTNLAERAKCAVLAINYRLMPENSRMDGIEDCRMAYRWMLENGPDGKGAPTKVAVAGDSAGGNLTLSLINWVRDQKLRAPDAVVAISPATDGTCTSPSIRANLETDIMLQPLVGGMLKIPRPALLWLFWSAWKMPPSAPEVSPIFADLSGLPPTLVHVSAAEMLYDDARRYVAKAQAAGSPARLQSWAHMAHVWHVFDRMLPEAHEALDEINSFFVEQGFARAG